MIEKEIDAEKLHFVEAGLPIYLDALWNIGQFQKEIIERTTKVVSKRLPDLSEAMKLSLKDESISDDVDTQKFDGNYARVGCSIGGFDAGSGIDSLCFSLQFVRSEEPSISLCVSMVMETSERRDDLIDHCKKVSKDFDKWDSKEIGLADDSIVNKFDLFDSKLNALIDTWIKVWERI